MRILSLPVVEKIFKYFFNCDRLNRQQQLVIFMSLFGYNWLVIGVVLTKFTFVVEKSHPICRLKSVKFVIKRHTGK